jgi:superfamily I DNA/RNA helicase
LVEGITPTKKGDQEEERRIAFVGMSRAKELLMALTIVKITLNAVNIYPPVFNGWRKIPRNRSLTDFIDYFSSGSATAYPLR